MKTHLILCTLVVLTFFVPSNQRSFRRFRRNLHEPPRGTPSFLRHAVESPPSVSPIDKNLEKYQEEFGSKSLPLRTAVESVPDAVQTTKRLPLRDAVEKRPPPDEVDLDENMVPYQTIGQIWPNEPAFPYKNNPFLARTTYIPLQRFQTLANVEIPFQHYRQGLFSPYFRTGRGITGRNDFFHNSQYRIQVKSETTKTKKIICYINTEGRNRRPPMAFVPTDLNSSGDICTHVIYSYAIIDPKTFEIKPKDDKFDIIQGGYKSIQQLKSNNPNLKTLISIRGSVYGVNEYNNMIKTAADRAAFIGSLMHFLDVYGFDGVDLQWKYPGGESLKIENSNRNNYKLLLEELNKMFEPMGYVLSVTVPSFTFRIDDGYPVETLNETVSFINLLFDFHSEGKAVSVDTVNTYDELNDKNMEIDRSVSSSVRNWINGGISPEKIILGIPFFGRSFTLQESNTSKEMVPILGVGKEGYYTREAGLLAYYEICDKIVNEGWNIRRDSRSGLPFIVSGDQFVAYEDSEFIKRKISYVNEKNLGGVHAFSVDLDDFKGLCGDKWPLLNVIAENLKDHSDYRRSRNSNCEKDGLFNNRKNCKMYSFCNRGIKYDVECQDGRLYNPIHGRCMYMSPNLCLPYEENFIEKNTNDLLIEQKGKLVEDKQKVVCYFTNWAFYRKKEGKFVPENIDRSLCTHIVYAFASLDAETLMLKSFDPWADVDNNLYERITSIPDVTSMLSLGGWTDSTGNKYSKLVQDMGARRKFVIGVVDFLKKYGFNGLHLDWNYPVCWQSNCQKGPASDRNNFNKLVEELRREFDQQTPRMILASAISGYREVIDAAYNIPVLSRHLDFMSVMTYDYHGSWEKETGHVSPLYEVQGDRYPQYNTNYTMNYLVQLGAPREKLLLGIPFYGQSFTLSNENRNQLGSSSTGPGQPGHLTNQPGMLAFYEICSNIRNQRWITVNDRTSGPYAYKLNQWVGYDDVATVEEKAKYARLNNFGGAVAWTIDLDDFNNDCCEGTFPLLKAVNRGLGRISTPVENDCTKPPVPVTPSAPELTTGVDSGAASTSPTWEWTEKTTQPTTSKVTSTTQASTTSWWRPSSTSSTTTSTTTQRTTTTTPSWVTESSTPHGVVGPSTVSVEKPKCNVGEYFRDPKDCNSYYRCVQGQLEKMSCAGNLHWNSNRGICDWPASAQCVLSATEDDTPVEVVTTPTTTKKPWDYWQTSTSSWESTHHWSHWNSPSTQSPTTNHWDQTSQWQTKTTSSVYTTTTTEPTTTTKPRTTTTTTTTTEKQIDNELDSCIDGQYYPHKECHKFYVCVNNRLVSQLCGPGLVWNVEHNRCDWKHVTSCGERMVYWDKEQLVHRDEYKPYSSCSGGTFAAYAGDCTKYLICLWGKFEEFNCAEGLYWNDDKKICDWPDNARCTPGTGEVIETGSDGKPDSQDGSSTSSTSSHWQTTTPTTTTTTEEIPQEPLQPLSGYFKIVCYFTNWAWYRQGVGKYLPSDIDPDLCTHIVYGFAVLNGDQKVIKPHDTWADFDNKFYEKVTAFKAKGIKVLIAIGGWNDSAGDKYSKLVNNPSARRRFITDVVEFIKVNNFDGLDLDWEYPKCWQVDCNKGPHSDKPAFAEFVKELREAFIPHGWLLSAAVSPSRRVIDAGYEVPVLSQYLDWIAVMCYDYHGQWDKVTGHVAPMYSHPEDIDATFNTNFTIHYWIEQGADPKKLVLGMPMYGQSFSLADNSDNGLNAPTYGGGEAGEETRARGFLSYYEICSNIQNKGWTVVRDKKMRIGPYAYQRDQWVSFDDIAMIHHKSQFIKDMGLGGGMIWALDLDDFKNICGCENYPLLKTINRVLRNYATPAPSCLLGGPGITVPDKDKPTTEKPISEKPIEQKPSTPKPIHPIDTMKPSSGLPSSTDTGMKCTGLFIPHESSCEYYYLCNQGELVLQKCADGLYWNKDHCDWPENTACHPDATTINPPVTEEPTTSSPDLPLVTTSQKPSQPGTTPSIPSEDGYKVVCYFTNWAWYRQGDGKYLPSDIDDTLCTHINYGFAVLDPNELIIKPHDTWADIDNEFYNRVTAYKIKGIKVLIAIGGWNDSLGNKYSRLVASPEARRRFIEHVIQFITKWNFDGLDLDWEYPKCWQVDCNQGPDADKENFATFLKELSEEFKPRGWLLTAAVSPSKMVIDAGYDVPALNQYLDWIAVMTYDYHGQWDKQTGHVAPLYYYPGDTYDYFNANFTLNYWIEKGAHPRKLIMGMPLYGQSFSLADASKHGLNSLSYGPGEAGEFTRAGGFLAFYEICERVKRRSWNVVRDPLGRIGPYAYSGNQWVSYDDISEIKRKSQFLKHMNLGGGMIWALDLDDFRNRCGCGKHPLLKMMNHELRGTSLETTIDNCT